MLNSKAKKFLKKIKSKNKFNMVKFAKKILPYKMLGFRTYNILTSFNINQSTKPIKKNNLLSFYKNIYDTWFDFVSNLDENKYKGKTYEIINKIKTDSRFKKINMTPLDCEKFIFENYEQEFSGSGFRFLHSQNKKIVNEDVSNFIHVYPFTMPRNINCRLYLNLKLENILKLGKLLTKKCFEKQKQIYYKFWTGMNDRNDTFLIYTDYNSVQDIINIIKEIKREKPEIFVGSEKSSGILPMIDGFIGFGEEPTYKYSSFNLERGEAFDEFFEELLKKQAKQIGNYNGTIHNSRGEDLYLKEYLKYILKKSFRHTMRTRQMEIMNRKYPEIYKTEEQIRNYIEIQTEINKMCKNKLPDFIEEQINNNIEIIIENLKSGIFPNNINFIFKTRRISLSSYTKEYAERLIKQNGSINYYFELDLNLRQKLFDVFNVKNHIVNLISEESLKPYFIKHHISFEYPYLNTETIEEIEVENNK